jgi:hypothetical protein
MVGMEFFSSLSDFFSSRLNRLSETADEFSDFIKNGFTSTGKIYFTLTKEKNIPEVKLATTIVYRPIGMTGYMSRFVPFLNEAITELSTVAERLIIPLNQRLAVEISSPEGYNRLWDTKKVTHVDTEKLKKEFTRFYTDKKDPSRGKDGLYFKELYPSINEFEKTRLAVNELIETIAKVDLKSISEKERTLKQTVDLFVGTFSMDRNKAHMSKEDIRKVIEVTDAIIDELESLSIYITTSISAITAYEDSVKNVKKIL